MSDVWDVVIVGGGGMGSSAACHLARRGKRVLLLERFGRAHDQGSSHGLSRIIRLAYFEHPSYVPLLRRAFELWRELEVASGLKLLHVTGSLDAGAPDSRTIQGSLRSCAEHGIPHELLSAREVATRFPAFRAPDYIQAVYQPDGGFLVPEACIRAHLDQAEAHGAVVKLHERAWGWDVDTAVGGDVMVETEMAVYRARTLVVAAGAWVGGFVPQIAPFLKVERQVVGWFDVGDRDLFSPSRLPVFNLDVDGEHWYGFPEFGVPGFKVGCYHHLREQVDPDQLDRAVTHERDEMLLRALIERCFPAADGPLLASSVCLFTNTPDEHFIIDHLPGFPQVVIASPCSGHGFKFASVIGEIVADLALDGRTRHDISMFSLGRFNVRS
ncbi:MAG: N-methyl-L-tryptophan oxidase [Gemmatimonadota bacterium]